MLSVRASIVYSAGTRSTEKPSETAVSEVMGPILATETEDIHFFNTVLLEEKISQKFFTVEELVKVTMSI